jgi:DNA-binding NarL/FixJ family response regulator
VLRPPDRWPYFPLKLLLADHDNLVRDALVCFIHAADSDIVMATASTLDGLLDQVDEHPDVAAVLLALRLPGMNGLQGLERLSKRLSPDSKIIILSGFIEPDRIGEYLAHGAKGIISKRLKCAALLDAVRIVLSGEIFVSADIMLRPGR